MAAGKIYRKKPKNKNNRRGVSKERLKLFRKTQDQINQVNKKLNTLQKAGYAGTWSSKKLINRIGGPKIKGNVSVIRKRGKIAGIKLSSNISNTSLIAVHKASTQFLNSVTSTPEGIKSVRERTLESLKVSLSDVDMELSDDEVEFLYDMLELREMQDLTEQFGASRVWYLAQDSIDAKDSEEDFIKRFEREIADLKDDDMKKKAEAIYKYIQEKL